MIQPQSIASPDADGLLKFKFTFSKLELEDNFDFLRFYAVSHGPYSSTYTLAKSFTGQHLSLQPQRCIACCFFAGGRVPDVFEIASENIFVEFNTSATVQLGGFRFVYETPSE